MKYSVNHVYFGMQGEVRTPHSFYVLKVTEYTLDIISYEHGQEPVDLL